MYCLPAISVPKWGYKWLYLLILSLCCYTARASHIMGSDITYKCVDKFKYEVTLKIYRDCNGIALGTIQQLKVLCVKSNASKTIQLPRTQRTDITGVDASCPIGVQSKCNGGLSPYGIEEHIFQATIDLNWAPNCEEFVISVNISARNKAITTGASNRKFYTEATIYTNLDKCNSSPEFTTPPTALICVGKDFVFNNGAIDNVDNDILTYRFIDPLENDNQPIKYVQPFSSQTPLTFLGFPNANQPLPGGFHLDPSTGNINFRPMIVNEVTVMVLEVTEWRVENGVKRISGVTRRDIQINVISCNNNDPPTIIGSDDTVCVGERICIPIESADINSGDKVTLTWNYAIPGASFTKQKSKRNPLLDSAVLCWTPQPGQARTEPYYFTVTAKDNVCPLVGIAVKAISIYVREGKKPTFTIPDSSQCQKGNSFNFVNTTPDKNDYTYDWKFSDGRIISQPDVSELSFNSAGKYSATLILYSPDGCGSSAIKQFEVNPSPVIDLTGSWLQREYCLQYPPKTYSLGQLPSGAVFSGANVAGSNYTPKAIGVDYVNYTRSLGDCSVDTVLPVNIYPTPKPSFTMSDTEQCISLNIFDFTNTSTIESGTYNSRWVFSDGRNLSTEHAPQIKFDAANKYNITLTLNSDKGCIDSVKRSVKVLPEPTAEFIGLRDYYCQTDQRQYLQPVQQGGIFTGQNIVNNLFIPNKLGHDTITYFMDLYGCKAQRTHTTVVYPVPKMDIRTRISCFKNPIEYDVSFPNSTYMWQDGSTLPTYTVTQTGKYSVTLYNICDTIERKIQVNNCYYGIVPTGFTPNGDGLNDVFMPYIENAENMVFEVYTRWGEKVYETKELYTGWDGAFKGYPMPDGVYVWVLKAQYYDGDEVLNQSVDRGNVTLIR